MSSVEADPPHESGNELVFEDLPAPTHGSTLGAEWWIAYSHLRSKKSEAFLSMVTVLSIVGVTAGVAMLNWVISVMTGFEIDLRDKILGANAHVVVFRYGGNIVDLDDQLDKIATVDGVAAAAPFVYTEMMVRSPWSSTGVVIKGVDPERTGDVTHLLPRPGHRLRPGARARRRVRRRRSADPPERARGPRRPPSRPWGSTTSPCR